MKKILLTFVSLLIISLSYAQVGLGIRAGYGLTKLTNRPYLSYESNPHISKWVPAPTAGIVMDVVISDILFFQMEALYAGLGTEYDLLKDYSDENQPEGADVTLSQNFHLVQLPILIKFATYDKKVTTYLEFGFNTSYFVSGEYKINNEGTRADKSGEISFENMKRWDFGFIIGFGFGTDFGKRSSWSLNLRYVHGVSDLNKNKDSANPEYVHNQTRSLTLSLILMVL